MRELSIGHKQHPARHGKSLSGLAVVRYAIASGHKLMIGSDNVDALYERIKQLYPDARVSKHKDYVTVEKSDG